eukprot:CAMPEP_0115287260 /NCGR_PEP_ID=MMETSP0270-20121206/62361_1 /TAXON_ID=71861 /ORGANISM="Scrippsiella trochoidea, Strain CCMP3099" /LENGTH=81 /DNA_ID=CAMNT_0002704321 /DNA_START=701 /DNA_END=947 /DNA_ORIENTATION=-
MTPCGFKARCGDATASQSKAAESVAKAKAMLFIGITLVVAIELPSDEYRTQTLAHPAAHSAVPSWMRGMLVTKSTSQGAGV